jgi:hypothetical protein
MRTQLQFLEYMEKQICTAGEKIYTAWLLQEISFRKSELESNQSPKNNEVVDLNYPCKVVNSFSDTHSTKQGHWEEIEYEDGCHTHKDTVWVEDNVKQELNKEISKDYGQKI